MSYGTEAILDLMNELGEECNGCASEAMMQEMIRYLNSEELIRFVHHFRSVNDMIDEDPDEYSVDYEEPNTEDMPVNKTKSARTVIYPGHSPGFGRTNDPIDW
jgi:hypothetical protein